MALSRDVALVARRHAARSLLAVGSLLGVVCCPTSLAIASDTAADRVLGQVSFAYNGVNLVDARGLNSPNAVAIDRSVTPNRVYVADVFNHRVLAWVDATAFTNGAPADLLIGQPDANSFGCNNGGVSADSLCEPRGVAVDGAGNLYVADWRNHRILEYDTPFTSDTSADRVFGQGGSFTAQACNTGGVSASSLCNPRGLVVDGAGNLYVADGGNHRVLEYDTPLASGTSADRVFGQGGSFTTQACNSGGVSASTLCGPYGVRLDGADNLYVADHLNNRVLEYDTPLASNTTADRVFGQGGSFTTTACDAVGSASANSLCNPTDVAVDGAGNVYIVDRANNRVLEYDTPLASGTTADRVFGQGGSFTTDSCNNGLATGASSASLCNPTGVALDAAGDLYLTDLSNHRVLKYIAPLSPFGGTAADRVLGQVGLTYNGVNLVDARALDSPSDVVIDLSVTPHRIYVADFDNSRVLAWANAAAFMSGDPADLVIGQPDFFSSGCNTGGRSASSLCKPIGVAVDGAGNLYVADYNNRRVLEYNTPFASGTTADRVYGRGGSFTTQGPACSPSTISADSICNPGGVAVDQAGNLYVADSEYDRVLEYDAPLTSNTIADRVFGQGGSFTSTGCNTGGLSASSLCVPGDVEVDAAGDLWVSDTQNHRVLRYDTPLSDTTADGVVGQDGSFTTNVCNPNEPGVSANGLCYPEGIAVYGTGHLYVVDWDNHRVLGYDLPLGTDPPDRVFGQGGIFTTRVCNLDGVNENSLCHPFGVAADGAGNLYVADRDNNRVLQYDTPIVCGDGLLDPGEACDDGNVVAGDCCSSLCQFEPAGTPCRASAGVCDPPESCTGSSGACPADTFEPATTECRSSAGECDPAETCTGTGPDCPGDARAPADTACSTDGNPCTVDQCDGTSTTCQHPAGNAGTLCRTGSGDVCDPDEVCDGISTSCPADIILPPTFFCRPAVDGCDAAEGCGTLPGQPCPPDQKKPAGALCTSDGNPCSLDQCDGVNNACQHPAGNAGATCRASAGVCDIEETCSGTSTACPADAVEPATTVCRGAAGECDTAERCSGTGPACPADAKSTALCRAAAGECNVAESCDGSSNTCPPDALQPAGFVCRAAAGTCDVAETCTGLVPACPPDFVQPNGTPCDDANACTTQDTCEAGTCVGTPHSGCSDHYLCYKSTTSGFAPPPPAHLVDQFEDVTATIGRPKLLCTPADKNAEGVIDPSTHERAYSFKQTPRHVRRTVTTVDQFGTLSLTTTKADLLFVPTSKDLVDRPSPPDLNTINVNHYKCYRVKITTGTPKFARGIQALVTDQFTSPEKRFDLRKPRHLCTPVDKNGEGVKNADGHLVCYQVKPATGQPRHARRTVFMNNQFSPETVTTLKESELCVPSVVTP